MDFAGAESSVKRIQTPLFLAIWTRNQAIVRLLLRNGAHPDSTIDRGVFGGMSPRSIAPKFGLKAIEEFLLVN